jgi:hypothetical protein
MALKDSSIFNDSDSIHQAVFQQMKQTPLNDIKKLKGAIRNKKKELDRKP